MATPVHDNAEDTERILVKGAAGRVEIDSRGRSVWRWACDVLESTSVLLKRLENHDLALEPTQKVPIQRTAKPGAKPRDRKAPELGFAEPSGRDSGGGFDPYNKR